MRNSLIILLFLIFSISITSCRKDFDFEPNKGELKFSRDTVYLDTVFKNIGSSTYSLKVYNRSNNNIVIPSIKLGKGSSSKYRLMVDGMTGVDEDFNGIGDGKKFLNVELLAKDSLFIFIETTADITDANPTDFLYTDQIQFDSGNNFQKVELVTLIQDAIFLYPQRFDNGTTETLPIGNQNIFGFYLDENDHNNEYIWTKNKPYVIYGYAGVPNGKTLNIEPGARIHFHSDSGLIIGNGGTLKVNGTLSATESLENEVIIEGDRLEPSFSDIPGQWGTIWLTSGSTGHSINHLTIKNASVGLLIDNNDGNFINIKNTQIYNSSNLGIYAKTAKINGENIVINSAGQAALSCSLGGSYIFKHCTFNNNWPSSKQVAVLIDNFFRNENNQVIAFNLQQAEFYNCFIFGSNQVELLINKSLNGGWTNPIFRKCQIKFNNTNNQYTNNPDYAFINDNLNIIKNGNPNFLNVKKNKMIIGEKSDGKGFGIPTNVPFDILGKPRTGSIDIGAYNHIIFPSN